MQCVEAYETSREGGGGVSWILEVKGPYKGVLNCRISIFGSMNSLNYIVCQYSTGQYSRRRSASKSFQRI